MDVAAYVQAFNEGVETGEWDRFVEYFSDDAVMEFEGPPAGPLTGKAAIRLAYRQQPPDGTIELVGPTFHDDDVLVAPYRWTATGGTGTMRFETTDGLISRLIITLG